MGRVEASRVLAYRARASHLDVRLPHASLAEAARGGLQDSAPRAAIISLHARVTSVEPSSWEHPSFVQIWGPRGADYLVPREDVAIFTLGRLPRDAEARAAIERMADDVHRVLDGRRRTAREVHQALPEHGHAVRMSSISGRVLIRWDASTIDLIGVEAPAADPEASRLELARRFLGWLGPATWRGYAWWAGVEDADAAATWKALAPELAAVEVEGERRFVLSRDVDALVRAEPVEGVRLIPHGDPLIKIDGELVVEDVERRYEIFPNPRHKTAFWPVAGALLMDGAVVGSWARRQRQVTVHPWKRLDRVSRERVEREALAFPIAARSAAAVRWTP